MLRNYQQRLSDSETETDWEEETVQNTERPPERSSASSKSHPASSVNLLFYDEQYFPIKTFGEIECGEPQKTQQLFFDFTPNTELDTPEVREKVMEFFEFINTQKDIAHLCKIPFPETQSQTKEEGKPKNKKADPYSSVDYTNKPVGQNLLKKYKDCICHLKNTSVIVESYPLSDDETTADISPRKGADATKKVDSRSTTVKKQAKLSAKNLCKTLEEWDIKHPKSMDPPGPIMQHHAVMQRIQPRERNY